MLEYKEITWENDKKANSWTSYPEILVWQVYYFPTAIIIISHKFSGLNNTNLSLSVVGQKSNTCLTGLTSRCQQHYIPFWRLQRNVCFLALSSFQRLPTFFGSWPCLPSSKPATVHCSVPFFHSFSQTDFPFLPPILLFKHACDYNGPTWIIQDPLPTLGSVDKQP